MLDELKNKGIENVVIFISDAVRYDFLPEKIAKMGVTFKTVSASTFTPPSFASIITGLHPFRHIHTFFDKMPDDIPTIMELEGYNTSFWNENTWLGFEPLESGPMFDILRIKNRTSLEDIEPPFIFLEHEKGAHCPFGWRENSEYKEGECIRFFHDFAKKDDQTFRDQYRKGVDRGVEIFEKRLQTIKDRGLENSTLIIYLADHGEFLGEYGGIIGHGNITCKEVVYTPTIFVHPSLQGGMNFENDGVIRHIDLAPTLVSLFGKEKQTKYDGTDLLNAEKLPQVGYNFWTMDARKKIGPMTLKVLRRENSMWDKDGGIVIRKTSNKVMDIIGSIYLNCGRDIQAVYLKSKFKGRFFSLLKHFYQIIKEFSKSKAVYGQPNFSIKEAEAGISSQMSNNKKNAVLLCNGISSGRNRTQFQRIKALCENYNLYIFSQMKVCEEIEKKATQIKYCPLKKFHLDELLFPFWAYWQTRKLKKQKTVDFVYTTYHNLEIFTGYLCSKLSIKWIADIWDHPALSIEVSRGGKSIIKKLKYWHGKFFFRQTKKHLKKASLYVIALAEGAVDEFGLPKDKIFYVTNGIDLSIDYGQDLCNADQFRLIYVGAVKKIRGVNFIIKAASFLKDRIPGIKIVLVGPGDQEDREYLENELQKNKLSGIIEWKGELPHSETLTEIQKSNVCLYPFPKNKELDFIYPIKIFEYMAMGKIVIANNSTGIKVIMKENEDAILFDPEKENDLGERIFQIYKDPALQGKLRQNSIKNVKQYDWSIINKSIINKINNFLGTYEN